MNMSTVSGERHNYGAWRWQLYMRLGQIYGDKCLALMRASPPTVKSRDPTLPRIKMTLQYYYPLAHPMNLSQSFLFFELLLLFTSGGTLENHRFPITSFADRTYSAAH